MISFSDLFTGLAVIMSGLALIQASQSARKSEHNARINLNLQHKIVALEEVRERDRIIESQKANFIVSLVKEVSKQSFSNISFYNKKYFLRIKNVGQAEARKVSIVVNEKNLGLELSYIIGSQSEITSFVGSENIESHQGILPPYEVSISWSDDFSKTNNYRTTLVSS